MMEITNITLIEQGDHFFKASFMYGDHNLETQQFQRSATKEEVLADIERVVANWEAQRADDNFEALKGELEGIKLSVSKGKVIAEVEK